MKVVGYTYDAAIHCVDCTEKEVKEHNKIAGINGNREPNADEMDEFRSGTWVVYDSEDNEVNPVFDTDEAGDTPDHCDDCGKFIDTSWHDGTVNYAISALIDYVIAAMNVEQYGGNPEVLDEWNENLGWCSVDPRDRLVMDLYTTVRQKEVEYEL